MTEPEKRYEYEDEINLMEYLEVIWKRKWLIIIPTFILVVLAGVYSFLKTPVWEVASLIQPAKFTIQTEGGQFEEVLVVPPKQIAGKINEGAYHSLISAELNLNIRKFPETKAETLNDTALVRVQTKDTAPEEAKSIHLSLFKHLKAESDKKVDLEMKKIESEIKAKQIDINKLTDEINTLNSKLKIINKRSEDIEKELVSTRERIEQLKKEQAVNFKKNTWSSGEALGMLIYSNEIQQQSFQYMNNLNESLSQKKIEAEETRGRIDELRKNIEQIENQIEELKQRKVRINYAQLIKDPTSSLNPVAPNKKLNVIIAGFLGLFLFTILAFFLEYIEKNKSTPTQQTRLTL
ncbi:MAG: Wzz/FepE/Etk N-terminal domain-containing protein [Candidatus Aminicenantaceae bacterium]